MPITDVDTDSLVDKLSDPIWRLQNLYEIRTKAPGHVGETVTFKPNKVQRRIYRRLDEHRRVIILKPRKLGVTTSVVIKLLDTAMFNQNQFCRTIAHRRITVQELFNDIARFTYMNLCKASPGIAPKAEYTTRAELQFENTGSKYSVDVEARGMTPTLLHFSEIAYVEDELKLQDTIESLPLTARGIAESTANGMGNWFHQTFTRNWQILMQGKNPEWYPLFFAWFDDPMNQLPMRPGEEFWSPLAVDEQRAKYRNMDGSPLSDTQLLWWDRKLDQLGDRLPELYPSDPEGAFIFTTGRVYPEFNRNLHVIPRRTYKDYEIVMDWGQTNPMVFLSVHQDEDGNFIFFREFYKRGCRIRDAAEWLRKNNPEKIDEQGFLHVRFADPSVFNKTQTLDDPIQRPGEAPDYHVSIADLFAQHKILIHRGTQNDVLAGIERVKDYLHFDADRIHPFKKTQWGEPVKGAARAYFTEDMQNTIWEFSNYLWPKDASGALNQSAYEVPIKKNDHAMDCVKYILLTWGEAVGRELTQEYRPGSVGFLVGAHLQDQREEAGRLSAY